MKNLFLVASVASIMASVPVISAAQGTSIPAPAFAAECGYSEDAPIFGVGMAAGTDATPVLLPIERQLRLAEHTSELQSLMRHSYAVFCLTTKKRTGARKTPVNT